ncbi:MAG TPA: DUF429 domain-containing protein, partial [Verrucomicrobiae bacterium]|nr:DUF429 domain-containing protein [Verrucomicrobiae bacterium]
FESRDELLRVCEIGVPDRPAACSLFWTLGAKQVGKAAITGWKEILNPATQRGALLWPFGGPLDELIKRKQLIIAETYPAEAYRHIGVKFRSSSKRSVEGRRQQYAVLCAWAKRSGVHFEPQCQVEIESGFERCGAQGEDAFDALIGLLGMIDVADGRRAEGAPTHLYVRNWEGWILGQVSTNY